MELESLRRLRRALAGFAVDPVVAGLTFVDPSYLPGDAAPASGLVRTCADLRLDFAFVPSWEPWAAEAVSGLRRAGVASLWVTPGVLGPALESLGVSAGLRLIARCPRDLEPALARAVEAARSSLRTGMGLDADGFVVADDLAGSAGPIVSPEFLREAVFPRLAEIASAVARDALAPVVLHCDGDARSLYGDIRSAGFSGVHGDCGGPGRTEAALGSARLAGLGLVGGIPAAALSDAQRGRTVGRRVAVLARGGGLVVADDGGVSTREGAGVLVESLAAARGA